MHQVGRPESQDRAGHGNWVCGVVLMMQMHESVRKAFQVWETDCSWSLISQGSGSMTSEKVMRSHEPTRASVHLCQPRGVAETAGMVEV